MPIGKKFWQLDATTDIDGLLGASEKTDGTPPGYKFTYSKTPNRSTPSDASVLTEKAVVDMDIYQNPLPTTTTVGGIVAGSTFFNTAKSYAEFAAAAAYAYLNPAFTSFLMTGISVVEVGNMLTAVETFTWAISNVGNVNANSVNIYDMIIPQQLITNHSVTSPATFDFSTLPGGGVVLNTPGNYTWMIEGTNTHSVIFTRNLSIPWEWRVHSGMDVNATLTNGQILALANSSLTTVFPPQVATAGGGYFWYWIPSTFTQPSIFKDHATGFAIAMEAPVTQSVTNAYGIATNYSGYRSTSPLISGITVDIT